MRAGVARIPSALSHTMSDSASQNRRLFCPGRPGSGAHSAVVTHDVQASPGGSTWKQKHRLGLAATFHKSSPVATAPPPQEPPSFPANFPCKAQRSGSVPARRWGALGRAGVAGDGRARTHLAAGWARERTGAVGSSGWGRPRRAPFCSALGRAWSAPRQPVGFAHCPEPADVTACGRARPAGTLDFQGWVCAPRRLGCGVSFGFPC